MPTRTRVVLLLAAHGLLGCSLIVDGELDGKDFGKEDGGASHDGGTDDAGGAGHAGGGGRGGAGGGVDSGNPDDAGNDAGADAGDRDSGVDSGTDSGPHDTLTIESTFPEDGDGTTYNVQEVRVVFSDDMDGVGDNQLVVTHRESGDRVAGSVGTEDDTATVLPASPNRRAGHYDVEVDLDVSSLDGVSLGENQSFTFEIVPGFPEDGDYIDRTDSPGSYEPDVAVDAEGNAIVIWLQRGAGGSTAYSNPWVARYTYGFGWSAPEALDDSDGAAYSPKIAVAADGTAFAAWTHDPNSGAMPTAIMTSHYTPSDGWSTPEPLDTDPDHDLEAQHVALAVNDDGDAVVAWARGDDGMANGQGDFYVSLSTAGVFGAPIPVLDSASNVSGSGKIEAALDSDGLAVVASSLGGGHSVWRQQNGTTDWARLASVYDSDLAPNEGTGLALDDDELPHMCADYDWGSIEVVRTSTPVKTRNAARYSEIFDPRCAMSGSDDVTAAWVMRGSSATTQSIWAITYDHVEDDWALAATDLFPDRTSSDLPSAPGVAAYLSTGALIAWASDGELYTVEREGGSFEDPVVREHVDNPVEPWVRVAASSIGTGVLVWQENDGSNPSRIAAQSFRGKP